MQVVIRICTVIIGTIIGAGYISGQEIYSFFNKYGNSGKIGIIISIGIISIAIYKTYIISKKYNIKNYEELLEKIIPYNNKILIYTIKNIINIFLIISFFIMCSAFSTYCLETYNLPKIIGGAIISLLSYLIINNNVKIIIKINEILMPAIIIFIIIMGAITINRINNITITTEIMPIMSGILYANYNSIVLLPMLITLTKQIENKKQIKLISIFSFIFMLILTILIYEMQKNIDIQKVQMPMLEIAKSISPVFLKIYGIMTGIAIFTSAISAGYSLIFNLENKKKKIIAISLCIIAIPVSCIQFSTLVNLMYPIFRNIRNITNNFFVKNLKKSEIIDITK